MLTLSSTDGTKEMKRMLLLLSFLMALIGNSQASVLWPVDDLYHLGEVLHSSRYDYDNGIEISLKQFSLLESDKSLNSKDCIPSSSQEILSFVSRAIDNHLSYYSDEEFDFDKAYNSLESILSNIPKIQKCSSLDGKMIFLNESNDFIIS